MTTNVNGFHLEVTYTDVPRVRVSFPNGIVIVDTDQVSIGGLGRLSDVFAKAEKMAFRLAEDRAEAMVRSDRAKRRVTV